MKYQKNKVEFLQKRLANKEVIIMDGATGTELSRRGVKTTLPLWSASALMTHPDVVEQVHSDYIKAGAEIIITNTFRTQRRTFAKVGIADKAKEITILACHLAAKAIRKTKPRHDVYIAGSIAPLEDCYTPTSVPTDDELRSEHYEQARYLKMGGVDFLLVETMNTIKEAVYALEAGRKVGLPVAVSFCCSDTLALLSGEPLADAVAKVCIFNPLFIGVNCVSIKTATAVIKTLHGLTKLPRAVYANGDGCPDNEQGWKFISNQSEKKYLTVAKKWVDLGAQVIGGCCGTNPRYIKLLSTSLPKKIS